MPTIRSAHEETRYRPDWHIVHTLEPPHAVKPRQCIARRELAPAHRQIAVESEQTGRGAAPHDLSQRLFVLLAPPAIGASEPPIHAPTAVAGTPLPKQIFERKPQIGRDRPDRKLHTGFSLLLVPYWSSTLDPRAHGPRTAAIAAQRVGLILPGTIEFRLPAWLAR